MIFGVRDLYFSTLELKNNPRKIEFQNSIKYSIKILWPYTELKKKCFKNIPAAGIYLFKINNRKTKIMREICSKPTLKTPE